MLHVYESVQEPSLPFTFRSDSSNDHYGLQFRLTSPNIPSASRGRLKEGQCLTHGPLGVIGALATLTAKVLYSFGLLSAYLHVRGEDFESWQSCTIPAPCSASFCFELLWLSL